MKKIIEKLIKPKEDNFKMEKNGNKKKTFSSEFQNKLYNEIKEDNLDGVIKLLPKISHLSNIFSHIFFAVTLERKEIFRQFLQISNTDWDMLNESGETLLHLSLKCSNDFFLNELLNKGINLNQKVYKTILHNSVATNKPNFVEPFLKCGIEMNNEDIMGMTPLDMAIENNNLEIVSMFLYYNCDAFPKSGNISPFMYSMLCNSDAEIQLLLLEYETDMNNADLLMNNLFIAVEKCEYLIPHILKYGADVNQICNHRNIFEFILEHSISSNNFELIWSRFDYEIWESTESESLLVRILNNSFFSNDLWHSYLKIVIESPKIQDVLNYQTPFFITLFVEEYLKRGFVESDFYELICILLMNGCPVYAINLHQVYNLLGSQSITLKLLVQMNIEKTHFNVDYNFIRVRYIFDTPINQLLRNFLFNMKIFDMTPSYKDMLRYFTVPPKVKEYLLNHKSVACPYQITWDHVVPPLVELSRNSARLFICKKYSVRTSSHYYSIIKQCVLPKVVKDILTFDRPLYFHKD